MNSLQAFTFSLVLSAAPVIGLGELHAQSQAELNMAAASEFAKADERLNEVYKRLLEVSADDPKFCKELREAQRAWLRFVELHMKTVFPLKKGENAREVYGSIHPMEVAEVKTVIYRQRIRQLQAILKSEH